MEIFPRTFPSHQATTHLEDFSELVLQSVVLVPSLSGGRVGGREGKPYYRRTVRGALLGRLCRRRRFVLTLGGLRRRHFLLGRSQ